MDNATAVAKVRKLLALANSKNEHEAANAAARAAEIMERHRLTSAMVIEAEFREHEAEEAFSTNWDIRAERQHVRMPTWYWQLAWAIAKANRCNPWTHDHPTTGQRRVTFLGRPSNARAAAYMLDAIANEVDRLAREYVAGARPDRRRSAGKSFRLGCTITIADRLEESAETTESAIRAELAEAMDETGLARLDRAIAKRGQEAEDLDRWAKAGGLTYRSASDPSVSSASAFMAGREAGHDVRLVGGSASLGHGSKALPSGR